MMETFTWIPRTNSSAEVNYRVRETQFGDGYTQASGDGLNLKKQQHEVSFTGKEAMVSEIIDFLDRHEGWKSFAWKPPLSPLGLYRCKTWSPTSIGGNVHTITATFIETSQP